MGASALARADGPALLLGTVDAARTACEGASFAGPRRLYAVDIASGDWRFLAYDATSEFLPVDTHRNLRALGGSLELFPSHLEPIGFELPPDRAHALMELHAQGLAMRLGFFLGFDEPSRTLCVVRPAVGVTTARVDVAFVELLDHEGHVVAREETERLRAYLDDAARDRVPGEGPRAAVTRAEVVRGSALTAAQRRALTDPDAAVRTALARCYTQARGRGAPENAQMLVRISLDAATGSVTRADATISTLGDTDATTCVTDALRTLRAPGGASVVDLSIRFVAD